MGNGVSSQGNVHSRDQRDIRSSVAQEQHDWQPESAVAPRQETLSLPSTRKSYKTTHETCMITNEREQLKNKTKVTMVIYLDYNVKRLFVEMSVTLSVCLSVCHALVLYQNFAS